MDFQLQAPFKPTGDQPEAIATLVDGVKQGMKNQVLLGATGTGKTFTVASVIQQLQMPALIMAHNKTLAAQLYAEFKDFFRTTQSNILFRTTIITNRKPTFRAMISTSKKKLK
jgi:excinuclease ABC subunit B